MTRGTVTIDRERCKGCALCVQFCPKGLLRMETSYNSRGYRPVQLCDEQAQCTGCAVCALMCPDVVFTVYRQAREQRR